MFIKYESFTNHSESNVHLIGIYCSPISCKWIDALLVEDFSTKDCIHANVTVMGQTMEARFRMNCSVEPCQLDIEVLPKGTSCYWVQN